MWISTAPGAQLCSDCRYRSCCGRSQVSEARIDWDHVGGQCVSTSESDPASWALANFLQDSSGKQLHIMMVPALIPSFSGSIAPPCLMSLIGICVIPQKGGIWKAKRLTWSSAYTCAPRGSVTKWLGWQILNLLKSWQGIVTSSFV